MRQIHHRFRIHLPLLALGLIVTAPSLSNAKAAPISGSTATVVVDVGTAAGGKWEFRPEGGQWKVISVPAGGWRTQGYTCDAGTYRTTLTIPSGASGKEVRVVFAAVNFGAEVFAGPDETHLTRVAGHIDGWVPVTADLTAVAVPGKPLLLEVETKGRRKFMVNGKYTVPEGATWDPRLEEGILRGVELQFMPKVYIDSIFAHASADLKALEAAVTVTNDGNSVARIRLQGTVTSVTPGRFYYPPLPTLDGTLAPGETGKFTLPPVAWSPGPSSYWWPNVPYRSGYKARLHTLTVALSIDGKAVHTYHQTFGFRTFAAKGSHYYLNGVRCNLRGDNQQEADFDTDAYGIRPGFGPPSPGNAGWPRAVDNLQRLNFNVMRIHQIPATPYMLNVCDEQGLMLVEESPLRGSEGGEDFKNGRDNMLNMDRELVHRDRNHPAIVVWSAANEWSEPIREAMAVIREEDATRPIIADGVGDMGPDVINMEHYVSGFNVPPQVGGHPREDRPYGETEDIWPGDNSLQGFAWMATSIRTRRLRGDADLRNYVLNNAWPNYVPGENPGNELLETRIKGGSPKGEILPSIPDPWHDSHIRLLQQCYDPLAVCDVDFDLMNARGNRAGDWPSIRPRLVQGAHSVRHIAVFNDEFSGDELVLRYEFHRGDRGGPTLNRGEARLNVPRGEFRTVEVPFDVPRASDDIALVVTATKGGVERFREDRMVFSVTAPGGYAVADGEYRLICRSSGLPAKAGVKTADGTTPVVQGAVGERAVWHLKNLGGDDVILLDPLGGTALTIAVADGPDGTQIVERAAAMTDSAQIWHITDLGDGFLTLTNKSSAKLLDVFGRSTVPGGRLVEWIANSGDNQQWQLVSPGKN